MDDGHQVAFELAVAHFLVEVIVVDVDEAEDWSFVEKTGGGPGHVPFRAVIFVNEVKVQIRVFDALLSVSEGNSIEIAVSTVKFQVFLSRDDLD